MISQLSGVNRWKRGRPLAYLRHGQTKFFFPVWSLDQWTSFCVTVSSREGFYRTLIDGEKVYEAKNFTASHKKDSSNIFLMNKKADIRPTYGAVTDLNIWDRALSEEEVRGWSRCELEDGGNFINWTHASLRVVGYKKVEREKSEVCQQSEQDSAVDYVPFEILLDYQETQTFCRKLGGEMAVSTEDGGGALDRMNEAAERVNENKCRPAYGREFGWFFSGHNDINQSGNWSSAESQLPVTLDWDLGFPKNHLFYDCAMINFKTRKYQDHTCVWKLCPICKFTKRSLRFHLGGVCKESAVDRYYVTGDNFNLVGYMQTRIHWQAVTDRWEIIDEDTHNVLAFWNETSTFPIGLHHWYFTENCTDLDRPWRSLSLHLDKDQPGEFCCDDGACIPSERVCDDLYDCLDRSDERNCSIVTFTEKTSNKNKPPVHFIEGKKNPVPVSASVKIYRVFEINEIDSSFDIFFKLQLQWHDKNLREASKKIYQNEIVNHYNLISNLFIETPRF